MKAKTSSAALTRSVRTVRALERALQVAMLALGNAEEEMHAIARRMGAKQPYTIHWNDGKPTIEQHAKATP